MRRALSTLVLPALFFAMPGIVARAADAGDSWSNPFCAASVGIIAWNTAIDAPAKNLAARRHYALSLSADGRTSVTARVVLIADEGAYAVEIPRTDLLRQGGTDDFYAEAMMVAFDKPVDVRYAYVDRVGVDGAAPADCPTVVSPVVPYDSSRQGTPPTLAGLVPIRPAFLQALPALTCGSAYRAPEILSQGPLVGHFGDARRTTVVRAYVDSDGIAVRERLVKSSGVEGLDDAALGGVQQSRFKPAEFLCTPVVSEMLIDMDYSP
ncbi:MAG TPA: hypothetical protein VJP76_03310 [Candidatus Tumulicola sp.]|nr:hypothetical protein [Candidatus Tumulicola sp.]